jgi:hypothetical protein|tara:strand:- start:720 stop:1001 length:282 start_codon:yes stop_codon:yes gene_type:complete
MFEELVIGMLAFNACLTVWAIRQLSFALDHAVEDLDGRIAKAIGAVMSGELVLPEPINPIQQAIAQMLTNNLGKGTVEIGRNPDGTFSDRSPL